MIDARAIALRSGTPRAFALLGFVGGLPVEPTPRQESPGYELWPKSKRKASVTGVGNATLGELTGHALGRLKITASGAATLGELSGIANGRLVNRRLQRAFAELMMT